MPFEAEKGGLGYSTQTHLFPPPKFTKMKLGEWFSGHLEICEYLTFKESD